MGVKSSYRPDIDGLRAISVIAVLLFHAFPGLLPAGYLGVDVFFVISGYLITRSISEELSSNDFSLPNFYFRRVRRIFPSLLVVLLALLIAGWFLFLPDEIHSLTKHIISGIAFVSNFVLWSESGYFDLAAVRKPLLHLWSLAIEEQFYLVWPILLWTLNRLRIRPVPVILFLIFTSMYFHLAGDSNFYLTHARIWEIACGGLLACISLPVMRSVVPGLALLVLCFIFSVDLGKAGHILAVLSAAIIISDGKNQFLGIRGLVFIGLISYPLYLWHWPLLSFARTMYGQEISVLFKTSLLLLSVILAWGTFRLVELPIRKIQLMKAAIGLLCVGVIIGIISLFLPVRGREPEHSGGDLALRKYDEALRNNPRYASELMPGRFEPFKNVPCHIYPGTGEISEFLKGHGPCLRFNAHKPNILVLGDSLAKDIHDALLLTHPGYNFLQLTGLSCRPNRKLYLNPEIKCYQFIDYAFKFAEHPSITGVIVVGQWNQGFREVKKDLIRLKGLGKKVMMGGHPLEFREGVPTMISRRSSQDTSHSLTEKFLIKERLQLNSEIKAWARDNKIVYLDQIDFFCEGQDYKFISEEGEPYFYDHMHMTKAGIDLLGERIFSRGILKLWMPAKKD